MKPDEIVISSSNARNGSPRRSLNLETINTTELKLLSPLAAERAEAGDSRDAALIAYAHRLRESYRFNENGFRYGMQMLAETVSNGQALAISCACRGGEFCHADVVRLAVERVGARMEERGKLLSARTAENQIRQEQKPIVNIRTQRAINEIQSYSSSDRLLSQVENTEGRTRPEHASHLNSLSQFIRDDYERGTMVREGIAVIPRDTAEPVKPLEIATGEYAVKRLSRILGEEAKAKEMAPRIVEYGEKIAGASADRESRMVVFSGIYDALEGRRDFIERQDAGTPESKTERFERNLAEIAKVAEEMGRLEPSDRLILADDISQGGASEEAVEHELSAAQAQGYERINVRETDISKLIGNLEPQERDRWFDERFPEIDRGIEDGTPVNAILKAFQDVAYKTAVYEPENKREAMNDLEIARAYVQHQLTHTDVRMRHENERYREYALKLENATTRTELMEAASAIRIENARDGFALKERSAKEMSAGENKRLPKPLTSREMQFLFTEVSPRHYTAEMTAARLSYGHFGSSRDQTVKALIDREIKPGPEASLLIENLESRLERRQLKDSISATKHFLRSLSTPNEQLRYKNAFDHFEIYRKLPPAERDFVYQKAVTQVEDLDRKAVNTINDRQEPVRNQNLTESRQTVNRDAHQIREKVSADLTALLRANPKMGLRELTEGTSVILRNHLRGNTSDVVETSKLKKVSQVLAEKVETSTRPVRETAKTNPHMLPGESGALRRRNDHRGDDQRTFKSIEHDYGHSR